MSAAQKNWFFMMVLAALYAISYLPVSSPFHQFITNPREDAMNRSLPCSHEKGILQIILIITIIIHVSHSVHFSINFTFCERHLIHNYNAITELYFIIIISCFGNTKHSYCCI